MVICFSYPWKQTQSSDISRIPARARSFEKRAWWGREDQRDAENSFFLLSGTQSPAVLLGTLVMFSSHSQDPDSEHVYLFDDFITLEGKTVPGEKIYIAFPRTTSRDDPDQKWKSEGY